jgi:hypothetical protein
MIEEKRAILIAIILKGRKEVVGRWECEDVHSFDVFRCMSV